MAAFAVWVRRMKLTIESERIAAGVDGDRIKSILSVSPVTNFGEDRQTAVKTDIETYKKCKYDCDECSRQIWNSYFNRFFESDHNSIFVVIMVWAGYIYPAFVYHICVVSAAEFYFIHAADL